MSIGIPSSNPLDYTGPQQNIAPIRFFPREPTTTDKKYRVGQLVIIGKNPSSGTEGDIWYLSKFDGSGDAQWIQLLSGSSTPGVDEITTDDGSPSVKPDVNSNINILGGTGIAVTGNGPGDTVTVSTDTTVSDSFPTDSGTATPSSGVLNVLGGTLLNTAGASNNVTVNADDNVVGSVVSDSGTATPTGNAFTIAGTGGITTSGAAATITIDGTSVGNLAWSVITDATDTIEVNNGYFANRAGGVAFTLPVTAAVGDTFALSAMVGDGWSITQNASQNIRVGNQISTTGAGGSIASTAVGDTVTCVCSVANTTFQVISSMGNLTIV